MLKQPNVIKTYKKFINSKIHYKNNNKSKNLQLIFKNYRKYK